MAAGDLVTLDAARDFLQFSDDAVELDGPLQDTITRASLAITRSTYGREFTPTTSTARVFEWDGCSRRVSLAPYDLRTATSVVMDSDSTSPTTLAATSYRLAPVPASFGVYTRLELAYDLSLPAPSVSWTRRRVQVTGDWGFAAVPADVQQACLLYVAAVIRRDVQAFGSALQPNSFGEGINEPEAFPPGVRGLLAPYMRMDA
jgi:hypothetical protein